MRAWPVVDQKWVERYRMSMVGKHVPALTLEERERELLDAVREAEVPATELFGDAGELAAEDATELATVDEAVRASLGGGLRPALREVGHTLVGIAAVAVLLVIIRHGWSVDIDIAHALVAAGVLIVFVGWVVTRALFSSGRSISAAGALVFAAAIAIAGIVAAANLGSGHIAAHNVPVPLLALVVLTPGIVALVVAGRMPQPALRESWDDARWLDRFRGGLRSRLMPAGTARGHVAEIEQALGSRRTSAYEEFGHPLALARELAAADQVARARRWWASTIAGTGAPLVIAALVLANQSWGTLTIPVAVVLAAVAALALGLGWGRRPWAKAQ
ncbi:hypothetical protein [Arthrobacter castelli]|uniref:hypothetical protein n=1 Tax=Arthrobacter castelli TaxID=271431 RepID=UPI001FE00BFF|nr:hypothetical protein [Arthrobacter castelli]